MTVINGISGGTVLGVDVQRARNQVRQVFQHQNLNNDLLLFRIVELLNSAIGSDRTLAVVPGVQAVAFGKQVWLFACFAISRCLPCFANALLQH